MKIRIEIDQERLRQLVLADIKRQLGSIPIDFKDIDIQTKSKQNYKSEWEVAAFRAIVDIETKG